MYILTTFCLQNYRIILYLEYKIINNKVIKILQVWELCSVEM